MFGSKLNKVNSLIEKGKGAKVLPFLTDKDESVRLAAIDGVGKMKLNEGINPLINLLHDSSAQVRAHAALALAGIGEAHSKAHVSYALEKETDAQAKTAMQQALAQLKNY